MEPYTFRFWGCCVDLFEDQYSAYRRIFLLRALIRRALSVEQEERKQVWAGEQGYFHSSQGNDGEKVIMRQHSWNWGLGVTSEKSTWAERQQRSCGPRYELDRATDSSCTGLGPTPVTSF